MCAFIYVFMSVYVMSPKQHNNPDPRRPNLALLLLEKAYTQAASPKGLTLVYKHKDSSSPLPPGQHSTAGVASPPTNKHKTNSMVGWVLACSPVFHSRSSSRLSLMCVSVCVHDT